jgi:glycosyltransferase involved in cell wall biosynthesis
MRASPIPAVSIVMPTFNRLRFIRLTVESVFAQTFADWELIIADDGSDEHTREYLRTLASEPRVKLIWLPHTGIPAVVRNAALREARGEYVAFLDSDDLWAPRKLERQFEVLRTRVGCRWIYTAFSQVDASGQLLPEELHRRWIPYEGSVFERLVTGQVSVRTPSVLATRELIMRAGGFDEKISSGEDYDLWMRMALDSDLAVIDEPLVQVRRHDENHSRVWHIAYHGRDRVLEKLQTRVDASRRSLLRSERVKNGLKLASEYASLRESANMLRALRLAFGYSWSHAHWWLDASKILARGHLPRRLLDIYRAHFRGT